MTDLGSIKSQLDLRLYIASDLGEPKERSGGVWKFKSPFRDERSPSFAVFPDHFHDFGDPTAHGDLIDYIQRRTGKSFKDTLEMVGASTALPRFERKEDAPEKKGSPFTYQDAERYHANRSAVKEYLEARHIPENLIDTRLLGADTRKQSRTYVDLAGKNWTFACSRCSLPYVWNGDEVYSFNFRRNDVDAYDCLRRMSAFHQCDILERMRTDIAGKEGLDPAEVSDKKVLERCFGPRFYRPHTDPRTRVTAYGVDQLIRKQADKLIYPRCASVIITEGEFNKLSVEAEGFLCIALKAVKSVDVRRLLQNVRLVYIAVDPDEAGRVYANMMLEALGSDYTKARLMTLPDQRDFNLLRIDGELGGFLESKPYYLERIGERR